MITDVVEYDSTDECRRISVLENASVLRVPVLDDISVSSTGTRRTNGSSPAAVRRSGTLARLSADGWKDGKTDVGL